MIPRKLKVVPTGDFWRGKVVPQIRLQGKWLEKAGIAPETHVEVENPEAGVLIIRRIPAEGLPCASQP
jgi:hypothetical protein